MHRQHDCTLTEGHQHSFITQRAKYRVQQHPSRQMINHSPDKIAQLSSEPAESQRSKIAVWKESPHIQNRYLMLKDRSYGVIVPYPYPFFSTMCGVWCTFTPYGVQSAVLPATNKADLLVSILCIVMHTCSTSISACHAVAKQHE